MSRVLIYGLMALSLGLSGCQATKMQSTPTTSASGVVSAIPNRPMLPPVVAGTLPGGTLPDRPHGTDPRDPVMPPPPTDVDPLPLPIDPGPTPTGGGRPITITPPPRPIDVVPTVPVRPGGTDPRDPRPVVPVTPVRPVTPVTPITPVTPTRPVNPGTPVTLNPVRPLTPSVGTTGVVPNRPTTLNPGFIPNAPLPPTRPTGPGFGGEIPVRPAQVSTLNQGFIKDAPLPPQRPTGAGFGGAVGQAGATSAAADFKQFASVNGTCEERPVRVEKQNKKLSFVFMVDTSASLVKAGKGTRAQGELTQIAHGLPAFIRKLPADLDYRIGVVLAHGPKSPWFGKLFSVGSNDPLVLNSKTMSEAQIIAALERKMMNVPDDKSAAQGEALNLGLYELTSHRQKIEAARDAGLFATGRDLIVIAVTDEQDVCYDYSTSHYKPVEKPYVVGGKTVWGPDVHETKFFNETCKTFLAKNVKDYTAKEDRNHVLNHNDVIEAFRSLEQKLRAKVIMQAIVYKTPQAPRSAAEDDKEMGHGIIELVQGMNSGDIADLANVDQSNNSIAFANELTQLGDNASFQLSYSSSFDCRTNEYHPDSVNKQTIELEIMDNGHRIARYSTACELGKPCQDADGALSWRVEGKDGGKKGLRVYPADQNAFARALKASNIQNPTQKITFKTLENVDPATGKKNDGSKVKGPNSHGPIPKGTMTPAIPAPAAPASAVAPKASVKPGAAVKPAAPVKTTAAPVKTTAAPTKTTVAPATSTKATDSKVEDKKSNAPAKTAKATSTKPAKAGLPSDVDAKK